MALSVWVGYSVPSSQPWPSGTCPNWNNDTYLSRQSAGVVGVGTSCGGTQGTFTATTFLLPNSSSATITSDQRVKLFFSPTTGVIIRNFADSAYLPISASSGVFSAGVTIGSTTLITTTAALTNGAGAATGTLLNAPSAGDPTKWIPINDNGTTRYVPAW